MSAAEQSVSDPVRFFVEVTFDMTVDLDRKRAGDDWRNALTSFHVSHITRFQPHQAMIAVRYTFGDPDAAFEFKLRFG